MDLTLFFALLGGLLFLAFIANRLVRFTRVPDIIILMATGVLIGPVLHWVNPDIFRGALNGFGSLALILILFEGGMDLKLQEILQRFGSGFFLSVFSYVLASSAVAAVCRLSLDFSWLDSLIVGAVLGCVSSSIILPVLQQVSFRREVRVTMLVEASLGDALAVLAVTTLLNVAAGGSAEPRVVVWELGSSLILAVAAGVLAGMLWSYLLPFLSEERFWHVLTFGAVLLVYSGVNYLQGNDLVAVLTFGLMLSNFPAIQKRLRIRKAASSDWFSETPVKRLGVPVVDQPQEAMLSFHGELAFLLRTFFFVMLGTFVQFAGLKQNIALSLECFAAILVARIVAVQAGRLAWRSFTILERELMVWFIPRGLITAVLGIEVLHARGRTFSFLPSLAFALILLTNLGLIVGTIRGKYLPQEGATREDSDEVLDF